jgi:hypothetical protein
MFLTLNCRLYVSLHVRYGQSPAGKEFVRAQRDGRADLLASQTRHARVCSVSFSL